MKFVFILLAFEAGQGMDVEVSRVKLVPPNH